LSVRGMDADTAAKQAAAGMFGMVQQQATMMGASTSSFF